MEGHFLRSRKPLHDISNKETEPDPQPANVVAKRTRSKSYPPKENEGETVADKGATTKPKKTARLSVPAAAPSKELANIPTEAEVIDLTIEKAGKLTRSYKAKVALKEAEQAQIVKEKMEKEELKVCGHRSSRSGKQRKSDPAEHDALDVSTTSSSSKCSSSQKSRVVAPCVPAEPTHKIKRTFALPTKNPDPVQCLDQIDEMYHIYYELEAEFSPKPYMSRQMDINSKMRSILVDWLVEVHCKFKLQTPTLWLCVNILDRYLERVPTARAKLQLIGVTSLLIAAKYEEVHPCEVQDCVYITDYAYEKEEVLETESAILQKLDYNITVPTGFHFITRYLNSIQASERTRHVASYYAERNLQEGDMLSVLPHKFAASAIYAALKQQSHQYVTLKASPVWTLALQEESGLSESDIVGCARTIVRHVSEEPETQSKRRLIATKKKYTSSKFDGVASLPLPSF